MSLTDTGQDDPVGVDSAVETLRASPEFDGIDEHHCNSHLAQIYTDTTEQIAAAVAFVRQGLDRGQRCLYILDDCSRAEIQDALSEAGVDVAGALASDALAFTTVEETYLRDGQFDADEMLSFYASAVEDTTDEFETLRVVAGTSWLLEDDVTVEAFMDYESRVNDLFERNDCIALCQYDRRSFPPEVVRDVVRTHPHLVYDGTVCHNFYYTPPADFLGTEEPSREVDRMLETLVDRSEARTQLRRRQQFVERSYQITSDPELSFETKLDRLLEVGREWFGLETGCLTRLSPDGEFQIEASVGADLTPDGEPSLRPERRHFCRRAIARPEPVAVTDVRESGWEDDPVHQQYGLASYFGTSVTVDAEPYGTLWFGSRSPRRAPFSETERTFLELMSQWIGYELERRRRETRLRELDVLSRKLMDAETATEVSERVVEAAAGTLGLPITAVALDDENGRLGPVARTEAAGDRLPRSLFEPDGVAWEAFVDGERRVESADAGAAITEIAAFPLSSHGVLVTATTATGGFGDADREFVGTVGRTVGATLDLTERQRQLRQRERTLTERNETLTRLNRVNDIIRTIDQSLVNASTREEIETVVCEQLAEYGPYELALIGEHDPVTDAVEPSEWAGTEAEPLGQWTPTATDGSAGQGPIERAGRTREPQVCNDIRRAEGAWRQAALDRDYHATIALPLRYEGSLYGVLGLYAGEPAVFDDLERAVLTELTDNIAHAINAVESKKALVGNRVTQLEFAVDDPDLEILAVVRDLDCEFDLERVIPKAGGDLQIFFTVRGVSGSAVLDAASQLAVREISLLSERPEEGVCLFEATLDDGSLCATVMDHGGRPREVSIVDGSATVTVELAADAAVREFVTMFQTRYPDSELVAKRSHERPERTPTEFLAGVTESLSERQLEALETAYFSGYFEEPRLRSATEIAATMDIAQPTFNSHLRAALGKICEQFFEETDLP